MVKADEINQLLKKNRHDFASVVDFEKNTDHYIELDFTVSNPNLTPALLENTALFSEYISQSLKKEQAKFGIGGYMEHRTVYSRSSHFNTKEGEPRRLHLGVDIWGPAFTPIYSFMDAKVHSFAFNDNFGDYGATIILEHILKGEKFYSLYGHLSLKSIHGLQKGQFIAKGTHFCDFGVAEENGFWPPHLHFQLMTTMDGKEGDYPGVAKFSEKDMWITKIPDANLVLAF